MGQIGKALPQGMNGWIETHPYQPVLILRNLCAGDKTPAYQPLPFKLTHYLRVEIVDPARGNLLGFMNVRRGAPVWAHVFSPVLAGS